MQWEQLLRGETIANHTWDHGTWDQFFLSSMHETSAQHTGITTEQSALSAREQALPCVKLLKLYDLTLINVHYMTSH